MDDYLAHAQRKNAQRAAHNQVRWAPRTAVGDYVFHGLALPASSCERTVTTKHEFAC